MTNNKQPHEKRQPISLTARVMLFVALATATSLLLLGLLVQTLIAHHFAEQDAEELQVIRNAIQQIIQSSDNDITRLSAALPHAVTGHHGVFYRVSDAQGKLLYQSPGADLSGFPGQQDSGRTLSTNELSEWPSGAHAFRGALSTSTIAGKHYRIIVASDMQFHLNFLEHFRLSLWSLMAFACLLTLLAAWLGVHQGHAPLRHLSDSVRAIQTHQLHVRLDANEVPVELRDLVQAFNQMIERLQQGFTQLSNFSSDIAHELRTPLTNISTQTQVALGKARSADEYRELLYSNLEEQERLARMVNDMLWLAKTDHGLIKPHGTHIYIEQEMHELFDYFDALAEEKQVRLKFEGNDFQVHGDRNMLRRAFSNLLSNAIRHAFSDSDIVVSTSTDNHGHLQISIRNQGNDIPAEHLPRLFDRFYRADASRQRQNEGAGLGLAITHSVITLHHGQISVSSAAGSTVLTVTLPCIPSATDTRACSQHADSAPSTGKPSVSEPLTPDPSGNPL